MILTREQFDKYTCAFSKKFISDFLKEQKGVLKYIEEVYDSNSLLEFLLDYPEVNDKSKEYYYLICVKTFNDIPQKLSKKYLGKFKLSNCGNDIYNSYDCSDSDELIDSSGIKKSRGCYNCKDSNHLLYCKDVRNRSYVVFNKYVSKERFNELKKMNLDQIKEEPEFNQNIYDKIKNKLKDLYKNKEKIDYAR